MTVASMIRSSLAGLVVAASMGACAANPATGVAANGAPLRVQYSRGTGTYVSNDVVGTDVHKDASGNEVGSTDHYQPVEHTYQWSDWKYFQGRDELDEQDYYRLAGDQAATDQIAELRAKAARRMKLGVKLSVVGWAAALVVSSLAYGSNHKTLGAVGLYGGILVGGAGSLMWELGSRDMKNRHHLPQERADRAADVVEDCNEGRCRRVRGGRGLPIGARAP